MRLVYLELSARCTKCKCIYCDSDCNTDMANELSLGEIIHIVDQLSRKGLRWLFICGLGEPSEDPKLIPLLQYVKSKRIRVSMFTNGLGFSPHEIETLGQCDAHILLKLDTFRRDIFDRILGQSGAADRILSFLDELIRQEFVKVSPRGETNLAFSIVPTALNINFIPEVVDFCKANSIYPAIGEMEPLGKAALNIGDLRVSRRQLKRLHKEISDILGYTYSRPLCPGILSDFRIDHTGNCIVDQKTGLGCSWFLEELHTPMLIGSLREESVDTIQKKAYSYRQTRVVETLRLLNQRKPAIASGGGSRPAEWCSLYEQLMKVS